MKKIVLTLSVLALAFASYSQGSDKELVYAAIEDYVDGIYKVQPERIKKSVHPELVKKGYWKGKDKTEYAYDGIMTFDQLYKLAETWNVKGWLAKDAPRKIEIYDVQDQTACGKLTAYWGTDYFQLAKVDGKWMIMNILWQGPLPPKP